MLPCLLATTLIASLALAAHAPLARGEPLLLMVALGAAVAMAALLRSSPLRWLLATTITTACFGVLLAPGAESPPSIPNGGLARVTLAIERGGCGERGCWAEARLIACTPLEPASCVDGTPLIGAASEHELARGARITALARLTRRTVFRNPGALAAWPDTRPALQATLARGGPPRIDAIGWLDLTIASARTAIRNQFEATLHAPHAGIARALLLGEGSAVERELNDAIRAAGVSHVLAVSGMHVTLLVGSLVALLRTLWLLTPLAVRWEAARVAAALGALLAPLVARLCGASPSAERAAWTSTLVYAATALGVRPCVRSVTALIVGAYAVSSPRDALHPGFVLSVLATAALLSHHGEARGLSGALRESLRAWLATAPFLLLCFGQTSLVALLANVALLPVGTALVPLAAIHLAAAASGLADVLPTAFLLETADGAFVEAARAAALVDPGLSLPPLSTVEVLAVSALALIGLVPVRPRMRLVGVLIAAAAIVGSEWALRTQLAPGALRITFVDVGQGDAVLLETGDGHAALVDAGGSIGGGPDPGALAVVPVLSARRITRLDLIVLSHPHPDHYGGLRAVLEAVTVDELWDTGQAEAESEAEGGGEVARLLARVRERGGRVRRPSELCGLTPQLGTVRLEILAPCPAFDEARGPNDNSFVVRVVHGARSVLLMGDSEREAEASLSVRGAALASDVLKVAHHGSRTSSTDALLAAVKPWLAVISAGRGNRFGHPHPEVLSRLVHTAEHVLRTDQVGGIELRSDGSTLTVHSAEHDLVLTPNGRHLTVDAAGPVETK